MSSALFTAATLAGGMDALNMSDLAQCLMKFMTGLLPAMNQPNEPKDFEKVPMMRSTLSVSPKWSTDPLPWSPKTPNP